MTLCVISSRKLISKVVFWSELSDGETIRAWEESLSSNRISIEYQKSWASDSTGLGTSFQMISSFFHSVLYPHSKKQCLGHRLFPPLFFFQESPTSRRIPVVST